MSDKTKEVINYGVMYVGFLAIVGSIVFNLITN